MLQYNPQSPVESESIQVRVALYTRTEHWQNQKSDYNLSICMDNGTRERFRDTEYRASLRFVDEEMVALVPDKDGCFICKASTSKNGTIMDPGMAFRDKKYDTLLSQLGSPFGRVPVVAAWNANGELELMLPGAKDRHPPRTMKRLKKDSRAPEPLFASDPPALAKQKRDLIQRITVFYVNQFNTEVNKFRTELSAKLEKERATKASEALKKIEREYYERNGLEQVTGLFKPLG